MAGSEKEEQAIRLLDVLWKEGASFIRQHDVHLVYAQVLARQGHRKMAQTVLESMVESMPWLESGYIALARKLADDGKLAEAINVLEKGLNHIRTAPSVRDALAWYLASRGKSDLTRARNLALENVTLYPNSVEYRATLGYILLTLGLPASAVTSADPATLHARASARQPAAELGTTIAAAERHFAAGRWDQALELIAAGEGSREIISSENAAQAVFRMILAKSSPPHEFSPY
jgi:predicted Zn-dependent protease